jgi:hypothetical protein
MEVTTTTIITTTRAAIRILAITADTAGTVVFTEDTPALDLGIFCTAEVIWLLITRTDFIRQPFCIPPLQVARFTMGAKCLSRTFR